MMHRIPLAGLEALYEHLQRIGDWCGVPEDGPAGDGRVLVHRICGDYVQEAEVLRTADGRGWAIYVACHCRTCAREARVSRSIAGRETDLASAVNAIALELSAPPLCADQHYDGCKLARPDGENR